MSRDLRKVRGSILKAAREAVGLTQSQVAQQIMEKPRLQTISEWEAGKREPSTDDVAALCELYGLDVQEYVNPSTGSPSEGRVFGSPDGHMVVREGGDVAYDPNPDEYGTPAEQLMHYLGVRVGMRRVAGELSDKDLIAAAYTLGRAHGFNAEEFKKLDAWRDQILDAERGG